MSNRAKLFMFNKGGGVNPDFVFTVKTDNAGTSTDVQFTMPFLSSNTNSGTVDWGDGVIEPLLSGVANQTHTYAIAGTYEIILSGTINFWRFNDVGDKDKILNISNWGNFDFTTSAVFFGCTNLNSTATDAPIISTTNLGITFRNCNVWNGEMNTWDVSNVTNFTRFMQGCDLYNQPLDLWDTSNVTTFQQFLNTVGGAFNQDLSNFDITNVSNGSLFLNGTTINTAFYDAMLISYNNQLELKYPSGVGYTFTPTFTMGNANYTLGGASETARTNLESTFNWTIIDGGGV